MLRTLSSAQTFLIKVIFPTIWIGLFTLGTLLMFVSPGTIKSSGGADLNETSKWSFLAVTIVGTALIYWTCLRLKRVQMDDHALIVSNYRQEIRIPLQQIEEVTENRWLNIHPVTVRFRNETAFGTSIVFMPKVRWFAFWSSHPVVKELLTAADRASTQQSYSPAV